MLIIKLKKHLYFQYIETSLWLLFLCEKEQKLFNLPCLHPIVVLV